MRGFVAVAVMAGALVVSACGGGDSDESTATAAATASASATGTAATASPVGQETPGASATAATTPAVSGTPFSAVELSELRQVEVPGWLAVQAPASPAGGALLSFAKANQLASPTALVNLLPCVPAICWPLDREFSAEEEENMKGSLAPVHRENPDLQFEWGRLELADGYRGFFTYAWSFVGEGAAAAKANVLTVFYHDGANHMVISITPNYGAGSDTPGELAALMNSESAEAAAREIFAAFEDAYSPNE